MSLPAEALFRVWIYIKPTTSDKLLYRTLAAAQRACLHEDGEIEEWTAVEDSDRMVLLKRWIRLRSGQFVSQIHGADSGVHQ